MLFRSFEVIINCTDDYNLKIKLINAYKEEFFEESNINKLLILLDKNNILSKFIIENIATLDIEKQKILLFNYIKKVIVENGDIEIFKENMEYMNKNLLNIFDLNFSCSILSSMFEEKESFILDVKNIVEEMGDIMWFIALMCKTLNISMEDVAVNNIAKLYERYPEKYSDEDAVARADKA